MIALDESNHSHNYLQMVDTAMVAPEVPYNPFGNTFRFSSNRGNEAISIPAVTPPIPSPVSHIIDGEAFAQKGRPLHACPGLPRPNQEMKYFSWEDSRCSSSVNLMKMTHCDHSQSEKEPQHHENGKNDTAPMQTEIIDQSVQNDEIHAAITLSSCFKNGPSGVYSQHN